MLWEKFEGDGAFELGVFGFVDYAHPASAEFLQDPIM
jgi:hypothetical protein